MKVQATSCTVPNTKLGLRSLSFPEVFKLFVPSGQKTSQISQLISTHVYISMSSEIISGLFIVMSDEGTFEHDSLLCNKHFKHITCIHHLVRRNLAASS